MLTDLFEKNILVHIFTELPATFMGWTMFLAAVNLVCISFWKEKEARVVGLVFVLMLFTLNVLYFILGNTRLLSLAQVIWWTPMVAWLVLRLARGEPTGLFRSWLHVLIASTVISLAIGYRDLIIHYISS